MSHCSIDIQVCARQQCGMICARQDTVISFLTFLCFLRKMWKIFHILVGRNNNNNNCTHHLEMSHGVYFFFIDVEVENIFFYVSELLASLTSEYCSFYPKSMYCIMLQFLIKLTANWFWFTCQSQFCIWLFPTVHFGPCSASSFSKGLWDFFPPVLSSAMQKQ